MEIKPANFDIKILHHDPMIFTVDEVVSELECEHFKRVASENIKRSLLVGHDKADPRRTSHQCWVRHSLDEITQQVANRISELVQVPLTHAEAFQVLHYTYLQEYRAHHDAFDPLKKGSVPYLKNGGQRIVTALAYLNDVERGGETSFPAIKEFVTPKRGKIVVFHTCYKDSEIPHPDSFHGALPVIRGEKWAFNLWFRKNPRS